MSTGRLKNLVAGLWVAIIVVGALIIVSGTLNILLPATALGAPLNAESGGLSGLPTWTPSSAPRNLFGDSTPVPAATLRPTLDFQPYPTLTPFPLPTLGLPAAVTNLYPADYDPLTGLTVDDPILLDRRPIAVKIVNYPRPSARPIQTGLTQADVVYEHYIEDGLSRYVGIFYGKDPTRVGAVRSGRFFDEHLMRMYHAVLVYANMDDRVQDYFLHSDLLPYLIPPRDDNCPPLCRDTRFDGYNNEIVDISGIRAWLAYTGVDNTRQSLRGGYFSSSVLPFWMSAEANRVYIRYSGYAYNYWEYDPNLGRYLRFQDTADALGDALEQYAPLYDNYNGEQVGTDNLVVLLVNHTYYNKEDQVFEINLVGEGQAILFREGRAYDALWVRDQVDQPIVITDPAHNPLALKPGQTFYEVLTDLTTTTVNGADWRFRNVLPP